MLIVGEVPPLWWIGQSMKFHHYEICLSIRYYKKSYSEQKHIDIWCLARVFTPLTIEMM